MLSPHWAFSVESNDSYYAFMLRKSDNDFSIEAIGDSNYYEASFKTKDVAEFKSSKTKMDSETWLTVANYILFGDIEGEGLTNLYDDLKLECNSTDSTLLLTIKQVYRTAMGEVDAKLGDVSLQQRKTAKVNDSMKFLFEFGQILQAKQKTLVVNDHELRGLRIQADELVHAKKDYENDLFDRFAVLLNEKKIKINELMGYGNENVYVGGTANVKNKTEEIKREDKEEVFNVGTTQPSQQDKNSSSPAEIKVKEEPLSQEPLNLETTELGKRQKSPQDSDPGNERETDQDMETEDEDTEDE
jgi:hypothetical protein